MSKAGWWVAAMLFILLGSVGYREVRSTVTSGALEASIVARDAEPPAPCVKAAPATQQGQWSPDKQNSSRRFLYKRWHADTVFAGERFLTGELANDEVCREVAEGYNAKPSVVTAGAVTFECDEGQR